MLIRRTQSKAFDWTIPFTQLGDSWYPLVEVNFLTAVGAWIPINLIFDSGAGDIYLRPNYSKFFRPGVEEEIGTVGAAADKVYAPVTSDVEVQFLERTMVCDVVIKDMKAHSYIGGLFGRSAFSPFGFGFWESARELYVTVMP